MVSVSTVVRKCYVARLPAVRAVVETVGAEPHFILSLANGAVLFTRALLFRLVTHRAGDGTGHGSLLENCT